jgi:aryl-alcohol dehydrogenase-like predicted oxidoreductase
MPHRPLGKTGLSAAPIAFGAFKIGRNEKIKYAQHYDLPTDSEAERLFNDVLDLGIDVIDTAPAYGISEDRVGRFLSKRRHQFHLSTKVGETFENGTSTYDFSEAAATHSLERSLKRLRTDHLDFVFIHSSGDDRHVLTETEVVPTLRRFKDRGLIKYIGLSGKTVDGARLAMEWADALMIEYHPADTSHEPVLRECAERGIAVFVKKPLASGTLPPAEAIPFILRQPAVSTLVVGSLNLAHLRANLLTANLADA